MATTAVIVTGAGPISQVARRAVPADAVVIAADGGLDHALAAGLPPQIVVGDLDSISSTGRDWAEAHARVDEHPTAKAATDTELAIEIALDHATRRLMVIGNDDGTRIDHTFAAIGVLGQARLAGLQLDGWWGPTRFAVVHPGHPVTLDARIGTTVSALALHGAVHGVSITGVRWELREATLQPLSGLGISNEVTDPPFAVSVERGVVTVFIVADDEHRAPRTTSGGPI